MATHGTTCRVRIGQDEDTTDDRRSPSEALEADPLPHEPRLLVQLSDGALQAAELALDLLHDHSTFRLACSEQVQ